MKARGRSSSSTPYLGNTLALVVLWKSTLDESIKAEDLVGISDGCTGHLPPRRTYGRTDNVYAWMLLLRAIMGRMLSTCCASMVAYVRRERYDSVLHFTELSEVSLMLPICLSSIPYNELSMYQLIQLNKPPDSCVWLPISTTRSSSSQPSAKTEISPKVNVLKSQSSPLSDPSKRPSRENSLFGTVPL